MRLDSQFELLGIHVGVSCQPVRLRHRAPHISMIGILLIVLPRIVAQQNVRLVLPDQKDKLRAQFVERDGRCIVVSPVETDHLLHAEDLRGRDRLPEIDDVVLARLVRPILLVIGRAHVVGVVALVHESSD